MDLMPAELVAKIAEDAEFDRVGGEPVSCPPTDWMCSLVRHAWIVAAEALEERADQCAKKYLIPEWHEEIRALRAAARALRKAAREDVEP